MGKSSASDIGLHGDNELDASRHPFENSMYDIYYLTNSEFF